MDNESRGRRSGYGSHVLEGAPLLSPLDAEDPAFRPNGRLANLRYGDQVRAIWVTRYDFKTEGDIARIMRCSAEAGFNTVFFQVRGNATTYYPSKLEPWSECYGWKSPGFDPLQLAIQEAHACNLALHAWVNVMPMWRGSSPPTNPNQLYHSHPEWGWYNRNGARQPLTKGFYVSVNPCIPEARRHLANVCHEVISRYEVDGLHLDYIRFPNEPPVVCGKDYPRDQRTLRLYKASTGLEPEDKQDVWDQWRCECVTNLLRQISHTSKSFRPQLVVTAAVGAEEKQALSKFQDVARWCKERLLDAVVPMNYTGSQILFRDRVEHDWPANYAKSFKSPLPCMLEREWANENCQGKKKWTDNFKNVASRQWAWLSEPVIIMGASVESGDGFLHQKQLALALQRFGHFSVFCYSTLFGANRSGSRSRAKSLLPFLKILADASKLALPSESHQLRHPFQGDDAIHPEDLFLFNPTHACDADATPDRSCRIYACNEGNGQKYKRTRNKPLKPTRRTFRRNIVAKTCSREPVPDKLYQQQNLLKMPERIEHGQVTVRNWEAVKMTEAVSEEESGEGKMATDDLSQETQGRLREVKFVSYRHPLRDYKFWRVAGTPTG